MSKNPFCHKSYLGESSESDIRPSLYNQTLSTILKASQFLGEFHIFENFVVQISLVQANIWKVKLENRKSEMQNSQKHKNLEPLRTR